MKKIFLQRETLPRDVQNELVRLLSKELHELTTIEKDFLKARKDYLNSDERKQFKVDEKEKPEKEKPERK